jgi:hypothetical protein
MIGILAIVRRESDSDADANIELMAVDGVRRP